MVSESHTLSGYVSAVWTSRLLVDAIQKMFAKEYTQAGTLALVYRLQFTVCGLRPIPYNTPLKKVVQKYKQETVEKLIPS